MQPTADGLAELTRSAVAEAGLPPDTDIEVGSYYLANVDFPDEEEAMFAALTARRAVRRLEVRNDTLAVLKAGSPRGWGIGVVSGAGINAAGVYPDGREERFLGIGAESGDWGGGHGIAVGALGAAVRALDGRGPATVLTSLVESTFGADPASVAIAVHRGDISERQVLGFAPLVFDAAEAGDVAAAELVHRQADEVMAFVEALLHRMELLDTDVDVVLGGGTLQAEHPLLMQRVSRRLSELAPKAVLSVLRVPPVAGALASALALAGCGTEVIDRARAALA
jgi:N-acetylglucosamine kinase-like BadF-type ATPase